jgi:hypothetical protein
MFLMFAYIIPVLVGVELYRDNLLNNKHKKLDEWYKNLKEWSEAKKNHLIYLEKQKEFEELKKICDTCKKYENKWVWGNEIIDRPGGVLMLCAYIDEKGVSQPFVKRAVCPVHGDVLGKYASYEKWTDPGIPEFKEK